MALTEELQEVLDKLNGGDYEAAKNLLNQIPEDQRNNTNTYGKTIAHAYAESGNITAEGLTALKDAGIDLNSRDEFRRTIAHYYGWSRKFTAKITAEGLTALKDAGIDLNSGDDAARTIAHMYAAYGNVTIEGVKALIEAGVDLNSKTKHGQTMLDIYRSKSKLILPDPEITKLLMDAMKSQKGQSGGWSK